MADQNFRVKRGLEVGIGGTVITATASGSVGIGTTNPTVILDTILNQDASTTIQVQNDTDGTSANASVVARNNLGFFSFQLNSSARTATRLGSSIGGFAEIYTGSTFAGSGIKIGTTNALPVIIGTNNVEALRIDSSQRVGIGTTNPLSLLTVSSNQQNFEFTVGNSTFNGGIIEYINRITSTTRPDFNYYLGAGSNGAHKFYTNANERFRISSSGNVGIGTTNPQTLLQVGAASTQSVFVTSTGRVGVGTTNPAYKMEIWGDGTVGTTGENLVRVLTTSSTGYGSRIILNSTNITNARSYHLVAAGSLDEAAAGSFIIKDSVSDVARLVINASGSVGIGTTNPTSKLHVIGNIKATTSIDTDTQFLGQPNDTVSTPSYSWTSDTTTGFYRPSSGNLGFTISGTERLRLNTTGVGIGTTNPQSALSFGPNSVISAATIDGSDNTRLSISGGGDASTFRGGFIDLSGNERSIDAGSVDINSGNVANSYVRIQGRSSTSDIRFWINASEVARFDSNGRLGIGTTNPTAKLEPVDTAASPSVAPVVFIQRPNNIIPASIAPTNADLRIKSHSSNVKIYAEDHSAKPLMILTGGGNLGIGTTNPTAALTIATVGSATTGSSQIYLNGATSNRIDFNTNGGGAPASITRSVGTKIVLYPSVTASSVDYAFGIESSALWASVSNSGASFKWYAGTTQLAILRGDGNLGIGTTNPQGRLHVGAASTQSVVITSTGSMVIGGTSAAAKLYVNGGANNYTPSASGTGLFEVNAGATSLYSMYIGIDDQGGYFGHNGSSRKLFFDTNETTRMTIDGSGNVGIGTTNPTSKLDVRGSISIGRTDVIGINSIRSVTDINSWEHYGISFSVGGEDTSPTDIYFKDDGTKMFILGDTGNDVNEYALSTAWDVSSAAFTTNYSVAAEETNPNGLYFKPDGTVMYICGQTGVAPLVASGDYVHQYTLGTAWDISNTGGATVGWTTSFRVLEDTAPQGVYLKNDDGTKMYIVGSTGDRIYEYALGTAWDVSTAGLTTSILIGTGTTQNLPLTLTAPVGIDFNASGTKMYIIDNGRDIVSRFDLSTPWDINTAIFFDNVYIGFQELSPTGVFYQEDQSKAYIVGATGDRVYQYNTDVPSLELASSGISTRSSIILNNEARLNNRLYVTSDAHFSSPVTLKSTLQVDSSIVTSSNLTVSGGTITAGNVAASLLTGNTTTNISFATAQTTGTFILGNTSGTGTITLGRATTSQQTDIQAGASGVGTTKTINLGTGGLSGSTTRINIGPTAGDGVIFIGAGTSIGIGTANPETPLNINSTSTGLKITRDNQSFSVNANYGGQNHCAFELTNALSIRTGAGAQNERVRIDASGNVGIGTTNPSAPTHILYSNSSPTNYLNTDAGLLIRNNGTNGSTLKLEGNANLIYGNGSASLIISDRQNERIRITSSGNVGIGITNPGNNLQVAGSAAGIRLTDTTGAIGDLSSTGWLLYQRASNSIESPSGFSIQKDSDADVLTINSSGNLGIGTTNPTSKLHVIGSIKATTSIDTDTQFLGQPNDTVSTPSYSWTSDTTTGFYRPSSGNLGFTISGTERLRLNTTGVGIGTTNPSTLLHLNSTDPTIRLKRSDAATNAYGEITSDTSGLIILKSDPGNAATNSGFSLTVDNIERVRVGSAGSVGIGITNATSRLYVLGDLASEYAATFFNDGNNANRFGIRIQCGVDTGSGTAIAINDGDGTNQGNVTFNAGTVTYGAFTANHDCVIPSYSQEIPYGSLMIVNKILYKKRIDGTEMERGIIYESGISTLPYVKNLLGAYSYQYDPDSPMQQAVDLPLHQVLVLGDGHIRCCNENGNIKIGDGITSSSMEGVGMRMNKIGMVIGIAQEDVDFTDANEVKLVPVQYGLHQYIPDNISEYLETLINQ